MEFQFFDPVNGVIAIDLSRTYTGLDAIFQRIAYTFVTVIGEKLPQTDDTDRWIDSEWNEFQTAGEARKRDTAVAWLAEAVSRIKLSDVKYRRPDYEALASLDVESVTIMEDTIHIITTLTARSGSAAEYLIRG